ncbi:MAG: hypothetical protein DMD81_11425 [Candidatus Rokuibacteriota bacterium]|nr:MAG: hypothetical protein DMD81_11425 [Candidatus Rokubacteria bacterium]
MEAQMSFSRSLRQLAVLTGTAIAFSTGGDLAAQTIPPGGMPELGGGQSSTGDEMMPRLFLGRNGEVLRLWQRRGDDRQGGGTVSLARATPPDKWRTLVELRASEKGVSIRDGALAISPSNDLAVVYRWWRNSPRAKQLRLARSTDGGATWSQPGTPIDGSSKAFEPVIGWGRGRTLVVVWSDERRADRGFDVYVRRSPDGGSTWESEQILSRFPEVLPADLAARPRLVADGQDRFWVLFVGLKRGRSSLYVTRSVDGGRTWSDPVAVTGESQSVYGHSLERAGDRLLVVWQDARIGKDRLYAATSKDAGATWTAPARVDHLRDDAEFDATSPTVMLGNSGEALVAWEDRRNGRPDIFLQSSKDGGVTWAAEDQRMDMDEPGTAVSRFPKLREAPDGRVALVWEDDRGGLEAIYLRVRSAGDKPKWGPEIRVSPAVPKVAGRLAELQWAPDHSLYVAWEAWTTVSGSLTKKRVEGKMLRIPES